MKEKTEEFAVRFTANLQQQEEQAAAANELVLSHEEFEQFVIAIESAPEPSGKLMKAAQDLDREGF